MNVYVEPILLAILEGEVGRDRDKIWNSKSYANECCKLKINKIFKKSQGITVMEYYYVNTEKQRNTRTDAM